MTHSDNIFKNPGFARLMANDGLVRRVRMAVFGWLRRRSPIRSDSIGAAILLVVALIVIVGGSGQPSGPTQGEECVEVHTGSGTITHSEVIHLWLPESVWELASPQAPILRDPHDLRRYLQRLSRQDLRYAVTIRGHQGNGDYFDIHFIRTPCDYLVHFQELLNVLADVSVIPGHETAANFPGASTHVVSEEILRRKPSAILKELDRIRQRRR